MELVRNKDGLCVPCQPGEFSVLRGRFILIIAARSSRCPARRVLTLHTRLHTLKTSLTRGRTTAET